jgi:hypothetical protein
MDVLVGALMKPEVGRALVAPFDRDQNLIPEIRA